MCYPGGSGVAAKIGKARQDMTAIGTEGLGVDLGTLAGIGSRPLAIPQRRMFTPIPGIALNTVSDPTKVFQ